MLREYKLTINVLSDYAGQFGISEDPRARSILKTAISPVVKILFPHFSGHLTKHALTFYHGNTLYNKNDHISQHEIIGTSPMNDDKNIIQNPYLDKIVFVGNESNRKGLHSLLKALTKIERDISLTIIGTDELTKLNEYSGKLDIELAGVIYDDNKFYDILSQHDALVMPSLYERQGKVQLEAMSAGVVPICSDSGGVYTTVTHLYNGLLFPPRDVDALVGEINRLYSDKELYFDLQNKGLDYVANLSVSEQVDKMAKIMKRYYD
jgi:glycosyltransferase involved in cell wall biosynthesis